MEILYEEVCVMVVWKTCRALIGEPLVSLTLIILVCEASSDSCSSFLLVCSQGLRAEIQHQPLAWYVPGRLSSASEQDHHVPGTRLLQWRQHHVDVRPQGPLLGSGMITLSVKILQGDKNNILDRWAKRGLRFMSSVWHFVRICVYLRITDRPLDQLSWFFAWMFQIISKPSNLCTRLFSFFCFSLLTN